MTDFVLGGIVLGTVLWSMYSAWCAHASGDASLCEAHVAAVIMGFVAGLMLVVNVRLMRLVEFQNWIINRMEAAAMRLHRLLSSREGEDGRA